MIDSYIRPLINPPLNFIGGKVASFGISPHTITIFGFIAGLGSLYFIAQGKLHEGLAFFLLNRIMDGIDGAVARHKKLTDFGGLLDILCDFIIYAGIVFAFAINDQAYAFAAAFLIFSFVGPITSFLAYAIIAAKRNHTNEARGKKSFYYLGGLCEGTETVFTLILMCLFPQSFPLICYVYGTMCWITTMGRVYNAWVDFGEG